MADDALASIPPPGGMPIGQALRELGRAARTGWHCAASAAVDFEWVATTLSLHAPGAPVFANLRAGAWHVRPPVHECRFKSTDGHAAEPKFCTARLNLHVVTAAASPPAPGAAIVDATRRGKAFPDALSRTVPAWCAVINRVVAAARGVSERDAHAAGWHTLHTPPWVPPSEADALARRVVDWANSLSRSGVDVSGVAAVLSAPLVPLWVSRSGVARSPCAPPRPHTPLLLVSASDPASTRARVAGPGYDHWFDYVPGGGDDEEAWAGGLRVRVFWEHRHALLAGGPAGWGDAVAAVAEAPEEILPAVDVKWHAVCGTGVAVAPRGGAAAAVAAGATVVHLLPRPEEALGEASATYVPLVVRSNSRHHDVLAACSPAVAAVSAALVRAQSVSPPPPTPPPPSIIIVADDGGDVITASCSTAVALAAASLLACFSPPPACAFTSPLGATHRRPCGCPAPPPATKEAVRDRVAAVAACVPGAAPSRDAVKGLWHWLAPVPGRRCVACGAVA